MSLLAADILVTLDVLIVLAWVSVPIIIVGIIVFCVLWSKRHSDFIKKAESIKVGMTGDDVLSIMGCSATTAEEDGDKTIAIWEKSQWKGIQHGGTVTRAIKVVFVNGKVTSVSSKHLDKSTFW